MHTQNTHTHTHTHTHTVIQVCHLFQVIQLSQANPYFQALPGRRSKNEGGKEGGKGGGKEGGKEGEREGENRQLTFLADLGEAESGRPLQVNVVRVGECAQAVELVVA